MLARQEAAVRADQRVPRQLLRAGDVPGGVHAAHAAVGAEELGIGPDVDERDACRRHLLLDERGAATRCGVQARREAPRALTGRAGPFRPAASRHARRASPPSRSADALVAERVEREERARGGDRALRVDDDARVVGDAGGLEDALR